LVYINALFMLLGFAFNKKHITIEEIDNFLKSKNYILKKKIYADSIAINEIWKFNE